MFEQNLDTSILISPNYRNKKTDCCKYKYSFLYLIPEELSSQLEISQALDFLVEELTYYLNKATKITCLLLISRNKQTQTTLESNTQSIANAILTIFSSREDWIEDNILHNNLVYSYRNHSQLNGKVGAGLISYQLYFKMSFRIPNNCNVFPANWSW